MLPSFIDVFAKYIFRLDSNIAGSKETIEASKVCVKEMAALESRKEVHSWTMLPGPVPLQIFPVDIIYCPVTLYRDASMFEGCRDVFLLQRFRKCADISTARM